MTSQRYTPLVFPSNVESQYDEFICGNSCDIERDINKWSAFTTYCYELISCNKRHVKKQVSSLATWLSWRTNAPLEPIYIHRLPSITKHDPIDLEGQYCQPDQLS
jgi:hypothetical protein